MKVPDGGVLDRQQRGRRQRSSALLARDAPVEDEPSEYEKAQMSRDFALGLEKFQGGMEG